MKTMYDNSKKSYLDNKTGTKLDYYYEPTGGTARDEKHFKEDLLNVCGNFAKTSLDCIEKQNNELEHLQNEKQQLISWLEDKIKEYKQILSLYERQNASLIEKARARNRISAYEEVIEHINNFVNKGGKE